MKHFVWVTALFPFALSAQSGPSADYVSAMGGYVLNGTSWTPLTTTGTAGVAADNVPAMGLWGYNASTNKWYACSSTNPCLGAGGGGGGGGGTPGGANRSVQYNNAGTFGGITTNASTTRQFLMQSGDGTTAAVPSYVALTAGDIPSIPSTKVTGLAPSATTDTTNASNITSGTLATNRVAGIAPAFPLSQASPQSTTLTLALESARTQRVHLLFHGDSFLICDNALVACRDAQGGGAGASSQANKQLELLRTRLQALYGSAGTGVVPTSAVVSSGGLNDEAWARTGTTDFSTTTIGPSQGGVGSLLHLANGATATFNDARQIPWSSLNVYCATSASTGSLSVSIDGGTAVSICGGGTGSLTAQLFTASAPALGLHSAVFTSTGDSYLYAAEGVAGTTGIAIDNLGRGGSTGIDYGNSSASQLAFDSLIQPSAVFIATLTNDAANNYSAATYNTYLTNAISYERSLASSPAVALILSPRDVVSNTYSMAALSTQLIATAAAQNTMLVNVQERGSTVGSTTKGFGATYNAAMFDQTGGSWPANGNAGVHPNDAGNRDEFQRLVQAIESAHCSINCTLQGSTTLNGTLQTGAVTMTGGTMTVNSTSTQNSALFTSDNAAGPYLLLQGSASGIDKWGVQSGTSGRFLLGDFTTGQYGFRITQPSPIGEVAVNPGTSYAWAANADLTSSAVDTQLTRSSAGVISFDTATKGNGQGTARAQTLLSTFSRSPSNGSVLWTASTDPTAAQDVGISRFTLGGLSFDTSTSGNGVAGIKAGTLIETPQTFSGNVPSLPLQYGFWRTVLTANTTMSVASNTLTDGARVSFMICQDSTGGRTFTWPASFKGAMTVGTNANTCSLQEFRNSTLSGYTALYAVTPGVVNQ